MLCSSHQAIENSLRECTDMERKSFLQGAAVLAAAGLVVKVLGAAFKIPITNLIGDTGMASFIPAYNVYNFFLVFSTAGIPVAISKMVSENIAFGKYREAHRIFKLSRSLMLGIGTLSYVMFQGAVASVLFDGFSPQAKGAAGASMGAAVGAVGGLVFIVILYYRRQLSYTLFC